MFIKPKSNKPQTFFKYHPIQVLDEENKTKINIKKLFFDQIALYGYLITKVIMGNVVQFA